MEIPRSRLFQKFDPQIMGYTRLNEEEKWAALGDDLLNEWIFTEPL